MIESLKVMGLTFKVIPFKDEGEEPDLGRTYLRQQRFHVLEMSPQMMDGTLIHEALHRICDAIGLDFDEPTVERLAQGFHSFMTDNPDFLRQVIGNTKKCDKHGGESGRRASKA